MTLTEFLLARIAEDEAAELEQAWGTFTAGRTAAFDAELRSAWEDTLSVRGARASVAVRRLAVALLSVFPYFGRRFAQPYADHPDFDPAWRTLRRRTTPV